MNFIADNQLLLLILCFATGSLGTALLFRKPAGHRAWRLADLVWVILGGIGALVAVVAGIYSADTSRLDRQVDVAYAATQAFDRDAARFRLRFCEPAYDSDIAALCDKVEFLSASTADTRGLPFFTAVTDSVAPLRALSVFGDDMEAMARSVDSSDPASFVVFAALDPDTEAAVASLRRKVPAIAGDFLILARAYEDLVALLARLKDEWQTLEENAYILALQVLALCLVSFAAPFRLGKSIVELRPRPR
jgi:hypothetical protein